MNKLAEMSHVLAGNPACDHKHTPIRLLEPTERHQMHEVRDIFREYAASLSYSLHYQGFEQELDTLPVPYETPHGVILLAADGNTIVGCAALRAVTDSVAELRRLYVRPSHQRRGIGRLLATTVVNRCRAMGYRAMRFEASSCMHAALTICEGLGFRQVPRFSDDPMPDTVFYDQYFPATRYSLGGPLRA